MRFSNASEAASLSWTFKGLPGHGEAVALDEIANKNWNVLDQDVMLPAAVIHRSALDHNRRWMSEFTAAAGVMLCPHGKTTMSPQLLAMQIADGAWGITAATVAHVRTYRRFGINRIILANQLVGKQNIDFILGELDSYPDFDFYCLVDSIEAIELLEREAKSCRFNGRLQVLLELGIEGGRTGTRQNEAALAVAERIAISPLLAFRGIEAFEGIVQNAAGDEGIASGLIERCARLAEFCASANLFEGNPILSAGGSGFFDLAAAIMSGASIMQKFEVVLRSGCYLVHDSDIYLDLMERLAARSPHMMPPGPTLRPALELWACVHSRPEPGRIIVGIGKRDASFDAGLPRPIKWCRSRKTGVHSLNGHRVVRLDDQHAYVDIPLDSPLAVGDLVGFGISHPCTTFDRWPALYLVDDAMTVTGAVQTFF